MGRITAMFLVLSVALLLSNNAYSQQGRWVDYSDIQFGSGSKLYDAGETCVGYTYSNASRIICFDINSASWNEINFQSSVNFSHLIADGNIVLIFGDTYLVAYNGLTSNFDTLRFEGAPLSLTGPDAQLSYKVDGNLAMFVTDQKMYVFNALQDSWQEFSYTMPVAYSGIGRFWIKDDYAAVILSCTSGTPPTNIAYSLGRNEFTETSQGGFWFEDIMILDYGFAGIYSTGTNDPSYIVGYSSATGQFTSYSFSGDYQIDLGWINTSDYVDSYSVIAFSARILITPGELVRYEMYGFNIQSGNWSHITVDINPQSSSEPSSWRIGGKFAISHITNQDQSRTLIFYNGFTESFETYEPGVNYYYSGLYLEGGVVYAMGDSQNVWVHNFETGSSSIQSLDRISYGNYVAGEDYIAFERSDNGDISTVYFWQGSSNTWTTNEISDVASASGASHVYSLVTSGYANQIKGVFYSPILNDVTFVDFDQGSWPVSRANRYLASASYSNRSYLYDSRNGQEFMFDGNIGASVLGVNCCIVKKENENVVGGYSAMTGTVTELQTIETPFVSEAVNWIGLAHESYLYTKIHVFNGFYGNWVELIPLGNHVGEKCGGKTAMVLRSSVVYAFDPEANITSTDDSMTQVPKAFKAVQNYPNPFNSSTIISYYLHERSDVTIEIYDLLGRSVEIIEKGLQLPGEHQVYWNSSRSSSGVYFYKIHVGENTLTKKMLLLK